MSIPFILKFKSFRNNINLLTCIENRDREKERKRRITPKYIQDTAFGAHSEQIHINTYTKVEIEDETKFICKKEKSKTSIKFNSRKVHLTEEGLL